MSGDSFCGGTRTPLLSCDERGEQSTARGARCFVCSSATFCHYPLFPLRRARYLQTPSADAVPFPASMNGSSYERVHPLRPRRD